QAVEAPKRISIPAVTAIHRFVRPATLRPRRVNAPAASRPSPTSAPVRPSGRLTPMPWPSLAGVATGVGDDVGAVVGADLSVGPNGLFGGAYAFETGGPFGQAVL